MPSFTYRGDRAVIRNLHDFEERVEDNLLSEMERLALRMENEAKTNRPWTDRTGNARRSIRGTAGKDGLNYIAVLAIGVYYGKYLELSNGGKYRVVRPTIDGNRQAFIAALKRAFR